MLEALLLLLGPAIAAMYAVFSLIVEARQTAPRPTWLALHSGAAAATLVTFGLLLAVLVGRW